MRDFVFAHFEHVLASLLLVSRLGDVLSTYLMTPKLKLEANPVVRRLRWPFAAATLLFCVVPYISTFAAVMALVPFLFVSASNLSRVWMARALGEEAYLELLMTAARRTKLWHAVGCVLGASAFVGLAGLVLSVDDGHDWGLPFSLGLILYSAIQALYGTLFCVRIFRAARRAPIPASAA